MKKYIKNKSHIWAPNEYNNILKIGTHTSNVCVLDYFCKMSCIRLFLQFIDQYVYELNNHLYQRKLCKHRH